MGRSCRDGGANSLDGNRFRRLHAPHGSLRAQCVCVDGAASGLQCPGSHGFAANLYAGCTPLMFPPREDVLRVMPEIIRCLSGILLMLVEPFLMHARRNVLVTLAALGSALALVSTIYPATLPGTAFSGLLRIDGFSVFVHVLVEAVAFLVIIGSADYLDREHIQHGEYYALILFATVGMCVMSSAAELMTAFVGLATSSISTYILASYRRDVPRSNESALKYSLLGSVATAFFLYGIALVYGATGTTQLARMAFPTTRGGGRLL